MTTSSHPRPDRRRGLTPDDRVHDAAAHEFWGDKADWSTPHTGGAGDAHTQPPAVSHARRGTNLGRWLGLLTAVRIAPTRTHAVDSVGPQGTADTATHDDWSDQTDDPFEDTPDDTWDEQWETTSPPAPASRPGVDPLLARFGGLAVIVTLLIPAFLGFTSDSDETDVVRTASAPLQIPAPPAVGGTTAADPATGAPSTAAPDDPTTPTAQDGATAPGTAGGAAPEPATSDSTPPTEPTVVAGAVVAQALTAPSCPQDYEVVAGDFWIRLADESGTPLAELLELNGATLDTPLFPGGSICLPAGAPVPAPPTTTPATPSTAPSTTPSTAPSTAPSTTPSTARPRSTTPSTAAPARSATGRATPSRPTVQMAAPTKIAAPSPVTPQPAPASTAGPAEVEAIIRAVWPDELEGRALEIARRESKFSPTAKNSCCYGVFQIYWSVHRSWLAGLGITSAEQLYDPALNARAALALYERAGSWGPWGG